MIQRCKLRILKTSCTAACVMAVCQGEVWWADLGEPIGSSSGFRRPVIVIQCDAINRSRIGTVVCVPLTSNLKWADASGNVLLKAGVTGLPKDSVANVALIVALAGGRLAERVGKLPTRHITAIINGIDTILGR